MISLEHIRQLQEKVNKAVEHMNTLSLEKEVLTEENDLLRSRISAYEARIGELEQYIATFKDEQSEIEAGIITALKHLDTLEQAVDVLKSEPAPASEPEATLPEPVAPAMSPEPEAPAPAPTTLPADEVEFETEAVEAPAIGQDLSQVSFEPATVELDPDTAVDEALNEGEESAGDDDETQKAEQELDIF